MDYNKLKWKIKKVSRNNWKEILVILCDLPKSVFTNVHQPCPLCRKGTDRYRFDDKNGVGAFFCNQCGAGDGFTFLERRLKKSEEDILILLDDLLGVSSGTPKINLKDAASVSYSLPETRIIVPAPLGVRPPSFWHFKYNKPSKIWPYRDVFGDICFYICRFDLPDGKKEVLPMTYCQFYNSKQKTLQLGWRWKGVTKNSGLRRPLYNLVELLKPENLNKWVMVVEGEKATDAGVQVFPELVVVTWSGGTKSIENTDWSPLTRRNVIIFGDNDSAGHSATIELYNLLKEYNSNRVVSMVLAPEDKPPGWDIADLSADNESVSFIKAHVGATGFQSLVSPLK